MPELPEVETVRRGLAAHLIKKQVTAVQMLRADLRVPLPPDLPEAITGRRLLRIDRRAKYLLLHFEGGKVLIAHLGMTGRMLLHKDGPSAFLKHDHVIIQWSDGHTLIFNDSRRFGLMLLTDEASLAEHPLLRLLGPEPLEDGLTGISLYKTLHASESPVKTVIMDQRKLVGVGNIYACEALFPAGISPARRAYKVTRKEAGKLAKTIPAVLEAAIASGGSTLRDYVRSSGDKGYFQHHFNVYGRQKKPCHRCGTPIQMLKQAGRSSFFCVHCQK